MILNVDHTKSAKMYFDLVLEVPFCLEKEQPLLSNSQGTILADVFHRLRCKENDALGYTAST
jgi:hypothetical protein